VIDESRKPSRILHRPDALPAFRQPAAEAAESAESAESAVDDAVAAGRAEGYRAGRELAAAELAEELERARTELATSLQRLATLETQQTSRLEARLLEITLEASSRITRTRIEAGDPVAARALKEALTTLPQSGPVRARLHPDDAESIRESLRRELDSGRLELVSDETLRRGGVIAETDAGRIDATLDAAEEALETAISSDETRE